MDQVVETQSTDEISIHFNATNSTLLKIHGNLSLELGDEANLISHGTPHYCSLTVEVIDINTSNVTTTTLHSDPVYMTPPTFSITDDYINPLIVGHKTDLNVSMTSSKGTLQPRITISTPFISSETQASVTDLRVVQVGDNVNGVSVDAEPEFRSREEWTRKDYARLSPPATPWSIIDHIESNDTKNNSVTFGFQVRMEDFLGMTNSSELWLGTGVRFGKLVWVGMVPLRPELNLTTARRPHVQFDIAFLGQSTSSSTNKHTMKFHLEAEHIEGISEAYAHDIRMFWYILPGPTYKSTIRYDDIKADGFVRQIIADGILKIEWSRLLFSDKATLDFMVSHTAEPLLEFEQYVAVVDVLYKGITPEGTTEYGDHEVLSLSAPLDVTYSPPIDPPCYCIPGNISSGTCPCCSEDECSCAADAPGVCLPCDQMWKCTNVIPEYRDITKLEDGDAIFICNYKKGERAYRDSSCAVQRGPGEPWTELPNQVATLLGRHQEYRVMYGIGLGGTTCVISKDSGRSWIDVDCSYFSAVSTSPAWLPATSVVTNEALIYATHTGVESSSIIKDQCAEALVQIPSFEVDNNSTTCEETASFWQITEGAYLNLNSTNGGNETSELLDYISDSNVTTCSLFGANLTLVSNYTLDLTGIKEMVTSVEIVCLPIENSATCQSLVELQYRIDDYVVVTSKTLDVGATNVIELYASLEEEYSGRIELVLNINSTDAEAYQIGNTSFYTYREHEPLFCLI